MKLPNSTKKREMRATLNTFKIMSLIKREMKISEYQIGQDWRPHMYQTGELSSEKTEET
jgi:hypothetical protein